MMRKKAFTLLEILLTVAIIAIIATTSLPFMLKSFGGFNEIFSHGTVVDSLQELYTVINRRIINKSESAKVDDLNKIIEGFAVEKFVSNKITYYKLANGTIIKELISKDSEEKNVAAINVEIPNCLQITLEGRLGTDDKYKHELRFILYPAAIE